MDKITLEVEKYQRKKDRLTQGFLAKMRSIISAKSQSIEHTGEVIQELETKREADQTELERAQRVVETI